ncbi:MAG: F0F1 ATP synthase subunit A [bacterium]|nr:F0F1 ATP synthase subunit A [bacterium]MCP4799715.1 F0F1 ATP synthase subunit A [bacterium]
MTNGMKLLLVLIVACGLSFSVSDAVASNDVHADNHEAAEVVHTDDAHGADAHGADAHAEEHHDGEHHDPYHLINVVAIAIGLIQEDNPEAATFLQRYIDVIFSLITSLIIALVFFKVYSNRSQDPSRLQAAVEMIVDTLYGLFHTVIGPSARTYTPYLGTLFLFIWLNNLIGLVPFGHSSTSSINTTIALALCTFVYVQYVGLTKNGILGYLHHLAGSPKSGLEWGFVPLMFPLHVLGELIKPLSLSLRLFGNVMGEDKLIAVFIVLGAGMLAGLHIPFGIPIQVPIVFLALLTSTIQALVFTLLSTVYIALMLPHDEEAHGH